MTEVPPNINLPYVSLQQIVRLWSKTFRNRKIGFGLWLLVFRSIIARGMNIIPKIKDHSLKTATVFGLSPPKSLPPEEEDFAA